MRGERTRLPVWLLLGVVAVLVLLAYYPFAWDPPRMVANDVTRHPGGTLAFGDHNRARSPGTPDWLPRVRARQEFEAELVARPRFPQRHRDTSIMLLADDAWRTNFGLGQNGSDLVLWLRRGGSSADGGPTFVVPRAFSRGHWTTVRVTVRHDRLRVTVDGALRLRSPLAEGSLRTWGEGRLVLGDEVQGGRGWRGELKHARVATAGDSVDYLAPGALQVPRRYLHLPEHLAPFPPTSDREWLILGLHLVSFVPVGLLIAWTRRPPVRPLPTALLALGLALLLAAGKFLFTDRHAAVADLVVEFLGALAGGWLAAPLLAWWHPNRPRRHQQPSIRDTC
ncbi:MAG: hypothetical protein GEV07_26375 [Streptosporangiales bacterium]|nr:hypothetical protein [Streptosporangiales bacterium]